MSGAKRDILRGNTIENRGYLFVYVCVWTYVCHFVLYSGILVFTLSSTSSQTSLIRILRFIDHYPIALKIELFTALNFFAGAVKTQKLMGALFLFE